MPQEIVVGVSGGIAAYKAAALVSSLVQSDYGVTVVMTRAARRFIGPATFRALTGRPVCTNTFDSRYPLGAHIELARQADLLCIAPASADMLAKAAQGLADDLLSTLLLCFKEPVLMAPAMNKEMWENAAVQRNFEQVQADGVITVGPQAGWLSCREQGMGRMADPEEIKAAIVSQLSGNSAESKS